MRSGDLDALKAAINTYDKFACLPDGKLYPTRELKHPEMFVSYMHVDDVINAIDNAPTVPLFVFRERPQGEWIIDGHHRRCKKCGEYFCMADSEGDEIPSNFCPNCGADMRSNKKETTFDDYLKEQLEDPEFSKEWEKLCNEDAQKGDAE